MTMTAGLNLPPERDPIPRHWILAAVVILLAHAGLLYWLIHERIFFLSPGAPPAAVMIDLAPLPEEPPVALPAEVPPEVVEPEPEPEEAVVIPEPPPAPKPVAVLMPRRKPKPVVKAPSKPVERPTQPTRVATAGAPSPGVSASSGASSASWHARVAAHIRAHRPGGATEHGTTVVSFTVDRGGHVFGSRVASSSGSAELDRAALAMVLNSNPVPVPPDDVSGSRFPFSVPVNFRSR